MNPIYGVMGSFATAEALRAAVERGRECGMSRWETFTPYPVEGVTPPHRPGLRSPIARAMGIAALLCSAGAFFLQEYAAHDYPLNVGGRPLHSWPAFVPITFELTILGTALTGVMTFFVLAGFPRLHHPVFGVPEFRRASQDRFFLLWRTAEPEFESAQAREFLARAGAITIDEVLP
jgi:hypothetical protein